MIVPALTLLVMTAMPQVVYIPVDKNDPNDEFAFEWEGLDVSGNPTTLELVEFVIRAHPPSSPPAPDIRLPTTGVIKVGTNAYLVRLVLTNVLVGRYKMNVRAKGTNGLFGEEGNDLFIEVQSKKPGVLQGLRHVAKP